MHISCILSKRLRNKYVYGHYNIAKTICLIVGSDCTALWFHSCLFLGFEGCAVASLHLCDPASCRVTYAHPVRRVSWGGL